MPCQKQEGPDAQVHKRRLRFDLFRLPFPVPFRHYLDDAACGCQPVGFPLTNADLLACCLCDGPFVILVCAPSQYRAREDNGGSWYDKAPDAWRVQFLVQAWRELRGRQKISGTQI
jgi:hypothetical protein